MGIVYLGNKGLIKAYAEETLKYKNALVEPGKGEAELKLAPLTAEEVDAILLKLDMLAMDKANAAVAAIVAEETESILMAIRLVKDESKASFGGILGAGAQLDLMWLRPKDVGGALMNPAATAGLGLYGGASGGVYTWLNTFVANTPQSIIPTQTMDEEAAVIHLGAIDTIAVPKLNAIRFTLAGIPGPAQSLPCNLREAFGDNDISIVRFEKPIICGPEKTQLIDVMPAISGDSKFELLSFIIAKAEKLTL